MGNTFRQNLRDELDYQGMTVKELAERSAVSKGALDSYLGKQASMPPADTAVRIAEVLGVTVEYLVTGKTRDAEAAGPFSGQRKRVLLRLFDELSERDRRVIVEIAKLLKAE
ncbi:MAG: helix-turn-helix domain-containing protein [Spirochaetaceae bacterium]|jgi:transcriptional regulator with XRE-family HTH domain|nr:helix-turn-helix domain-containing protein [Spirochaetaceae bacterium]